MVKSKAILPASHRDFWTIKQVAERFQVARRTVLYWIKNKEFDTFKNGQTTRITDASIRKFIERNLSSENREKQEA